MKRAAVPVALTVILAACASPAPPAAPSAPTSGPPVVHVIDATVRLGAGGDAILALAAHNAGAVPDTLVDAACRCAKKVEVTGDATIDPEQTALFTADGPHVTFTGFEDAPGDVVDVTLTFENAGDQVVTAEVAQRHGT